MAPRDGLIWAHVWTSCVFVSFEWCTSFSRSLSFEPSEIDFLPLESSLSSLSKTVSTLHSVASTCNVSLYSSSDENGWSDIASRSRNSFHLSDLSPSSSWYHKYISKLDLITCYCHFLSIFWREIFNYQNKNLKKNICFNAAYMVKDKFHIENGNDLSDLIFPQYTYIDKYIHIYIYIYI